MSKAKAPKFSGEQVRSWLAAQSHEHLVDLLCSHAESDPHLRQRLELEAAAQRVGGLDTAPFLAALDRAIKVVDFVEEDEVPTYAHAIGEVLSSVGDLLEQDQGHARAVVELMEHAQRQMQDAVENVGDDGGYTDGILGDIEIMHREACRDARLELEDLAARLWKLETASAYGFAGAVSRYADALGDTGLAAYRRLAEAAWATVPSLRPGKLAPYDARRATLTHIMMALAECSGDLDERIGVLSRDLSGPHQFVAIAKLCREAGSASAALAWAEQGVDAFGPGQAGPALTGIVIDAYQDRGRHAEAMPFAMAEFERDPTFAGYLVLQTRATRAGEWDTRREPARAALRRAAGPASPPWGRPVGRSGLVQALLADGEPDQAWQEAVQGGCADAVWLALAAEREAEHPDDAIEVYRKAVERLVSLKDKDAYAKAAGLVAKVATASRRARTVHALDQPGALQLAIAEPARLLAGPAHPSRSASDREPSPASAWPTC